MEQDNKLFEEIMQDVVTDSKHLFNMAQQMAPSYGGLQNSDQRWGKLELLQYQAEMLLQRIRLARQACH